MVLPAAAPLAAARRWAYRRGWMRIRRRGGRRFLLGLLPRGSVGAEIGVWRGDFSAWILRTVRPARLHLIDPWAFRSGGEYREA
jgi:hypothetical protein